MYEGAADTPLADKIWVWGPPLQGLGIELFVAGMAAAWAWLQHLYMQSGSVRVDGPYGTGVAKPQGFCALPYLRLLPSSWHPAGGGSHQPAMLPLRRAVQSMMHGPTGV